MQMQMQQFFTDLGECFGAPSTHAAASAAAHAAAHAAAQTAAQAAARAAAQAETNATFGPQNEDSGEFSLVKSCLVKPSVFQSHNTSLFRE